MLRSLRMTRFQIASVVVLLYAALSSAAVEKWADESLPVKDHLALWLDATCQVAAWEAHDKVLVGGAPVDVFFDGSGRQRDLIQPIRDAQPRFVEAKKQAALRFDGKDDHLRASASGAPSPGEFTAFLVACPRTNRGRFRAFLATSQTGRNDFETG